MKLIDNVNETWRDELQKELNKGSRISIVAASFSIYAFRELKKELSDRKSDGRAAPKAPDSGNNSFTYTEGETALL